MGDDREDRAFERPSHAWGAPLSNIPSERQQELRALVDQQRAWLASAPEGKRVIADGAFYHVDLTGLEAFFVAALMFATQFEEVVTVAEMIRQASTDYGVRILLGTSGLHLEYANLSGAELADAWLSEAHLEGADLGFANLRGADLTTTYLQRSSLSGAHLEGALLHHANLLDADLRGAWLDQATNLEGIVLGDIKQGCVRVADVRWGGVNLAVVDWPAGMALGDERAALNWQTLNDLARLADGDRAKQKESPQDGAVARQESRRQRAEWHRLRRKGLVAGVMVVRGGVLELGHTQRDALREAVRANRQLATALRDQGMNEEADHFAYRAQVLQQRVFQLTGPRWRATFSRFLDTIAGYGYKPERGLIAYVLSILIFAIAYFILAHTVGMGESGVLPFSPVGAWVFSMTSFHGRGFFPGGLALDDPITVIAAIEAFFGLVIEVSLIATFTQRFFGK